MWLLAICSACTITEMIADSIEVSEPKAEKNDKGLYSFTGTISMSDERRQALMDIMERSARHFAESVNNSVETILHERFGIATSIDNMDAVRELVIRKKLEIVTIDVDGVPYFVGVSSNNRWLYMLGGKVVGKKGKNWDFEKL